MKNCYGFVVVLINLFCFLIIGQVMGQKIRFAQMMRPELVGLQWESKEKIEETEIFRKLTGSDWVQLVTLPSDTFFYYDKTDKTGCVTYRLRFKKANENVECTTRPIRLDGVFTLKNLTWRIIKRGKNEPKITMTTNDKGFSLNKECDQGKVILNSDGFWVVPDWRYEFKAESAGLRIPIRALTSPADRIEDGLSFKYGGEMRKGPVNIQDSWLRLKGLEPCELSFNIQAYSSFLIKSLEFYPEPFSAHAAILGTSSEMIGNMIDELKTPTFPPLEYLSKLIKLNQQIKKENRQYWQDKMVKLVDDSNKH